MRSLIMRLLLAVPTLSTQLPGGGVAWSDEGGPVCVKVIERGENQIEDMLSLPDIALDVTTRCRGENCQGAVSFRGRKVARFESSRMKPLEMCISSNYSSELDVRESPCAGRVHFMDFGILQPTANHALGDYGLVAEITYVTPSHLDVKCCYPVQYVQIDPYNLPPSRTITDQNVRITIAER